MRTLVIVGGVDDAGGAPRRARRRVHPAALRTRHAVARIMLEAWR
jgi:hypothetical protein